MLNRRFYYFLVPIILILAGIAGLTAAILNIRSPAGKGFANLSPPIATVWAMYDSALRGDIARYLDCFVEDAQLTIRDTLQGMGEEQFKEYLQKKSSGIMGVSIYQNSQSSGYAGDTSAGQASEGDNITLPVEIVFKGRNEIQLFRLRRVKNGWKIITVSPPSLTPQPIPYGKNVNE